VITSYKKIYAIFFSICIAINIYFGIIDGSAKIWQHIFHIIAYSICWLCISSNMPYRQILYFIASLFPIYTHAIRLPQLSLGNVWFYAFIITILLLLLGNLFLRKKAD